MLQPLRHLAALCNLIALHSITGPCRWRRRLEMCYTDTAICVSILPSCIKSVWQGIAKHPDQSDSYSSDIYFVAS